METEKIRDQITRRLRDSRRIVIKLGTSVVDAGVNGPARHLETLIPSIVALKAQERQIVLVSSGAIGLGRAKLALSKTRLSDLVLRQACAAVGQSQLMNLYERLFSPHEIKIAQILLTEDDFTNRQRYSTLRYAMERLLKLGVIPIVNENDTVSTAELESFDNEGKRVFSDNDRLAALIMSKLDADILVILSNVDGLLAGESVVPLVTEMSEETKMLAHGPSIDGRGGMVTKLEAAEIAMRAGGLAVIANGMSRGILDQIFQGKLVGTTFVSDKRIPGKRRWIKYAAGVQGRLIINPGARKAILERKASLLSSGVLRIEQKFKAMDVVSIVDHEGQEFARGIANYASQEAEKMIATAAIPHSRNKGHVLVTRNNIVLND